MTTQIRFGNSALHDILSRYAFFNGSVDDFCLLEKTNANVNARFSIAGNTWVIKRYRPDHRLRKLPLAHWFQLQAQASGFPVARLVLTIDAQTAVALNDETYSVHEWVDGKHIDYPREQIPAAAIESLARHLARLHRLGRDLYQSHPLPSAKATVLRAPAQYVARISRARRWRMPALLLLKLKPVKTSYDRWILDTLGKLAPRALQIAKLDDSRFAQQCYIHNDIYWGNLIFDVDNELLALIDFDKLEVNSWEYEVGCAAAICATSGRNIRLFLDAYQAESGHALDTDLIILAMLTKTIRSTLWCVHAYLTGSGADQQWLQGWSLHLEKCLTGIEDFRSAQA